jgi:hypothetical protein
MDEYNWKLVINIICIFGLIFQIKDITRDYLQFSTNTDVELTDYFESVRDIDQKSLPAISICNKNLFSDIFHKEENESGVKISFDNGSDIFDSNIPFKINSEVNSEINSEFNSTEKQIKGKEIV